MFQGMEYIYEVYKEKSFSKAAAALFISQPSLSANVKRVENRIGYPIFDRSTKPLQLTEVGKHYIQAVEKVMDIENNLENFILDLGNLKTGTLNVGGSNFFSSWILPPLIADFSQKFPHVQISLVEESTAKLSQFNQIFEHYIYQKEQLLLAVPKNYSINTKLQEYQIPIEEIRNGQFRSSDIPSVPLNKFENEPFIILRSDNDTGKRALTICQENHFSPSVIFRLDQQMTAYNIACLGMGITFIGDLLLSRVPTNSELVFYKLPGRSSKRTVFFYWKKGRYISRAMEEFLKLPFS